jgi:uncharacterized protein YeaO (DUF488 family)
MAFRHRRGALRSNNIRTRRVYDPPVPGEGHRILVMRLWPRGISKAKVDRWLRELAPVLPLMRGFRSGQVPWDAYRPQYLAGLERPEAQTHVEEILSLAREGGVTLLCGCEELRRCHRSLLQQYLEERV